MLHVIENVSDRSATYAKAASTFPTNANVEAYAFTAYDLAARDIDIVDDALLNTSPHNSIERQLLNGDVVGLALMSGAILWSAMGAFG